MLKRMERISLRISSVLSKVEPEPGARPSHRLRLRPKTTGSGSTTLVGAKEEKSVQNFFFFIYTGVGHSDQNVNVDPQHWT